MGFIGAEIDKVELPSRIYLGSIFHQLDFIAIDIFQMKIGIDMEPF